jgi:putative ABC transport system permease protein
MDNDAMPVFKMLFWESRAAWRAALRRPAFLALSALTLALGIATCTATFALIDDFVLTPPPYSDPARLVVIGPPSPSSFLTTISPQQYQSVLGLSELESAGAASFLRLANLKVAGDPILVPSRPVTRSFLETLGVRPVVGRNFTDEEDRPSGTNAAIISDHLWASQFGRDREIVGRRIKLDGRRVAIVGVLPADFQFLEPLDVLTPLALPAATRDNGNNLIVVGRLAPGASVERASQAVNARMYSRMTELGIRAEEHMVFSALPLWSGLAGVGRSRALMFCAFGSCLFVLVGTNIFNLLSLRSILGHRENATRQALGASAVRLIAPALAEGLLVGLLGIALGLALAGAVLRVMAPYIPANWMNASRGLWLGTRALGVSSALGVAVPLFSAFLAARKLGRHEIALDLVTIQRAGWGPRSRFLGQALVIAQAALASGLLVVSISFSSTLVRLLRTDLGMRPERVLSFAVAASPEQYPDAPTLHAFVDRVVDRLVTISASDEAAAAWNVPIGEPFSVPMRIPNMLDHAIEYRPITAHYFAVLGIPILRGRAFADLDTDTREPVAIVNSTFESRYLKGEALGRHIGLALDPSSKAMRIVGVVGNTRQAGPNAPSEPIVYVPLTQVPDDLVAEMRQFLGLHFFIQTRNELGTASEARRILREIAPEQVVTDLGPLTAAIRELTADQQLDLKLVGTMTLLAILVANAGLYSIVSLSVASRKRDLGIKAALGAAPGTILRDILGSAAKQMGTGLTIGSVAGTLAALYLRSTVPGFEVASFVLTTSALFLLLLAGVGACVVPALRAARVDPVLVFREG